MIQLIPAAGLAKAKFAVKDRATAAALNTIMGKIPGVYYKATGLEFPAEPRLLELAVRSYPQVQVSPEARRWFQEAHRREMARVEEIAKEDVPLEGYSKATLLRPYQRVGANAIASLRRVLLCDEMGLGKSAMTIAAMEHSGKSDNALIVCPNGLQLNWEREIAMWATREHPVTIFESPKRQAQWESFTGGWAIVNYEQFCLDAKFKNLKKEGTGRSGYEVLYGNHYTQFPVWDWLIMDEAHRLKSRNHTQVFTLAKTLHFTNGVLLTGTPYGNETAEVWALLNLLFPEEYPSYWRFYEMYVDYAQLPWGKQVYGPKNVKLLRKDLASRMIRRFKGDVEAQLPPKMYQTIPLKLSPPQAQIYRKLIKEFFVEHDGVAVRAVNALSLAMRLRQTVSTLACFGMTDTSAKLDAATGIITGTEQSVLVFSLFKSTVHSLRARLEKEGVPCGIIIGDMSQAERDVEVRRFSSRESRALIATVTAAGVGLTLTQAEIVLFIDKHWNPLVQQQAEDRAHRIGQTKSVQIISLVCQGTIDDRVEDVLSRKISMQEALQAESLLTEFKAYLNDGQPSAASETRRASKTKPSSASRRTKAGE